MNRLRFRIAVGLAAAAVALAGVDGWLAFGHDPGQISAAKRAAHRLVPQYSVLLSHYDYRQLDADIAAVGRVSTKTWAKNWKSLIAAVAQSLRQYQVRVTASLDQCGSGVASAPRAGVPCIAVRTVTRDKIVALVAIDQTSNSKLLSAPRVDMNRMEITLVHQGGRWVVSSVLLV